VYRVDLLLQDTKATARRYATIGKNNVIELAGRESGNDPLTDLLKAGAEQLIYQAVEAELQELLAAEYADRRTEDGKVDVVRNGHLPVRKLQTGLGPEDEIQAGFHLAAPTSPGRPDELFPNAHSQRYRGRTQL